MDFKEYQSKALESDQVPSEKYREDLVEKIVPLLGLAGEAGGLLSEYKKHLRDGSAHKLFRERISEELGDLLWYISNVASKFDLDLETIAKDNIDKVQERFVHKTTGASCYILIKISENETLPRRFTVEIKITENESYRVQLFLMGASWK